MKRNEIGILNVSNESTENALRLIDLKNDLDATYTKYKQVENKHLLNDFYNSEIQVQLSDADGNIIVGNVKLIVGYCGKNLILSGEVVDVK